MVEPPAGAALLLLITSPAHWCWFPHCSLVVAKMLTSPGRNRPAALTVVGLTSCCLMEGSGCSLTKVEQPVGFGAVASFTFSASLPPTCAGTVKIALAPEPVPLVRAAASLTPGCLPLISGPEGGLEAPVVPLQGVEVLGNHP